MTLEQCDVVDLIGIEKTTGKLVLSIVDHLDWEDGRSHIALLVEKVNRYLAFVESGEVFESYPESRGRKVVMTVLHLYPISQEDYVQDFFANLRETLRATDVEFRIDLLPQDRPS